MTKEQRRTLLQIGEKRQTLYANYRLITGDPDGTLLGNDMTVSPENVRAIRAMSAQNIRFVPCSGRTFSESSREARDNPRVRYVIHSDGAVICADEEHIARYIFNHYMSKKQK